MTATSTMAPLPLESGETNSTPAYQVVFRRPPRWKRAIDILGAVSLLVVLLPLFLALTLYIKLVSRGPVLFLQSRIGAGAKPFVIYKFRTMEVQQEPDRHRDYVASLTDSDAPISKPSYESRLIRGGSCLRSLSLDELPQLWNVLKGEMSLVGPRPEVLALDDYQAWQLRRFEVLPGISGLWQVSGKNSLTFRQMIELDIRYVDNLSLRLDLKIIAKTVQMIVTRNND